jgi:hypothetical protein
MQHDAAALSARRAGRGRRSRRRGRLRPLLERLDVDVIGVELAIGLTRPLRVAVLGDIHLDPFFEVGYVERVVGMVNALAPDLILHTGDFVSHAADRVDELGRTLARLTPRVGHVAILGNHDQWVEAERVTSALAAAGIEVLRNRSLPGWCHAVPMHRFSYRLGRSPTPVP